jgi:hypothetical protein
MRYRDETNISVTKKPNSSLLRTLIVYSYFGWEVLVIFLFFCHQAFPTSLTAVLRSCITLQCCSGSWKEKEAAPITYPVALNANSKIDAFLCSSGKEKDTDPLQLRNKIL